MSRFDTIDVDGANPDVSTDAKDTAVELADVYGDEAERTRREEPEIGIVDGSSRPRDDEAEEEMMCVDEMRLEQHERMLLDDVVFHKRLTPETSPIVIDCCAGDEAEEDDGEEAEVFRSNKWKVSFRSSSHRPSQEELRLRASRRLEEADLGRWKRKLVCRRRVNKTWLHSIAMESLERHARTQPVLRESMREGEREDLRRDEDIITKPVPFPEQFRSDPVDEADAGVELRDDIWETLDGIVSLQFRESAFRMARLRRMQLVRHRRWRKTGLTRCNSYPDLMMFSHDVDDAIFQSREFPRFPDYRSDCDEEVPSSVQRTGPEIFCPKWKFRGMSKEMMMRVRGPLYIAMKMSANEARSGISEKEEELLSKSPAVAAFSLLYSDVLGHVLSFLPPEDLLTLGWVSRDFRELSGTNWLWRPHVERLLKTPRKESLAFSREIAAERRLRRRMRRRPASRGVQEAAMALEVNQTHAAMQQRLLTEWSEKTRSQHVRDRWLHDFVESPPRLLRRSERQRLLQDWELLLVSRRTPEKTRKRVRWELGFLRETQLAIDDVWRVLPPDLLPRSRRLAAEQQLEADVVGAAMKNDDSLGCCRDSWMSRQYALAHVRDTVVSETNSHTKLRETRRPCEYIFYCGLPVAALISMFLAVAILVALVLSRESQAHYLWLSIAGSSLALFALAAIIAAVGFACSDDCVLVSRGRRAKRRLRRLLELLPTWIFRLPDSYALFRALHEIEFVDPYAYLSVLLQGWGLSFLVAPTILTAIFLFHLPIPPSVSLVFPWTVGLAGILYLLVHWAYMCRIPNRGRKSGYMMKWSVFQLLIGTYLPWWIPGLLQFSMLWVARVGRLSDWVIGFSCLPSLLIFLVNIGVHWGVFCALLSACGTCLGRDLCSNHRCGRGLQWTYGTSAFFAHLYIPFAVLHLLYSIYAIERYVVVVVSLLTPVIFLVFWLVTVNIFFCGSNGICGDCLLAFRDALCADCRSRCIARWFEGECCCLCRDKEGECCCDFVDQPVCYEGCLGCAAICCCL